MEYNVFIVVLVNVGYICRIKIIMRNIVSIPCLNLCSGILILNWLIEIIPPGVLALTKYTMGIIS